MRKLYSWRLVFATIPLLFNSARAQSDHFAYAVTAVNKGGTEWVALRRLDTRSGEFSNILLNVLENNQNASTPSIARLAASRTITAPAPIAAPGNSTAQPNLNGVAAIAYDKKTNRLYYTPMSTDQLRYINLSTMEVNTESDQYFSKAGKYDPKFAGPISRMVIAPDDFGYTITNDGNHLIRFSTIGTPVMKDLGDLVDDPMNKEMTIHSPCTNSGGDVVADDAGNLFLITGSNKVYKIEIDTRLTTYLTTISGLPAKFTTSGVAVSDEGKLLISSSLYSDAYFIVDPENWTALSSPAALEIYGSADLANSNFLHSKTAANSNLFITKNPDRLNKVRIFPNPVMDDRFSIQFNELPAGTYTIQLANVFGKKVIDQKIQVSGASQTELMQIPKFTAQGFYYVYILDENNKVLGTQKLVVERW
jgi:Secretion system C-terminal sorting domain